MTVFDPYKTLQVDPEADPEVIQAAYRRLAQKYHPDLAKDSAVAIRMVAINRAWEILGDPRRRAAYDRERMAADRARAAADAVPWAAGGRPGAPRPGGAAQSPPRPADEVSRDWTSGRSSAGGGYDPASMRAAEGTGAAGPPPGQPSGSVLNFGRYTGWALGEIARRDLEYVEWLDRMPIGRPHRDEIDAILRAAGRRKSAPAEAAERRGLVRRR